MTFALRYPQAFVPKKSRPFLLTSTLVKHFLRFKCRNKRTDTLRDKVKTSEFLSLGCKYFSESFVSNMCMIY
jgi:hypothetical protein